MVAFSYKKIKSCHDVLLLTCLRYIKKNMLLGRKQSDLKYHGTHFEERMDMQNLVPTEEGEMCIFFH